MIKKLTIAIATLLFMYNAWGNNNMFMKSIPADFTMPENEF